MHLVFDFDGTITEKDTIAELAHAGLDFQQNQSSRDLSSAWSQVVRAYVDDLQGYTVAYPAQESNRSSLQDELDFLAGMRGVEEASLARVESSGVFTGMTTTDLFAMGANAVRKGKIRLREGFDDIVKLAGQQGWTVSIVSVNWSRAFIEGVIHPHKLQITANEISTDGKIDGPQLLGYRLTNSAAKKAAYNHVAPGDTETAIYFGDSVTDLECLLAGGIVVSKDETSSLMNTLRRIGFEVPHVSSATQATNIHWARNFSEVLQSEILKT